MSAMPEHVLRGALGNLEADVPLIASRQARGQMADQGRIAVDALVAVRERAWSLLLEELRREGLSLGTAVGQMRHGRITALLDVLAGEPGTYYSFESDKVLLEARHRMSGGEPRR